jgi:Arc/MetJ family transcription regulator
LRHLDDGEKTLADANIICIYVCMRTTLNLDEKIFEKASKLTGIKEKTLLLHEGLKTLIERESARRLAMLGGSSPKVQSIPRR